MNPLQFPPRPLAFPGMHGWPIGAVIPYAGPVADSDAGPGIDLVQISTELAAAGWLYCDGSPYACLDYKALFDVIGTRFGSATSDKGVAQFLVPDLRGRFIRGVDIARPPNPPLARPNPLDPPDRKPVDPGPRTRQDGATAAAGEPVYGVGTLETDAFQGHEHAYTSCGEGTVAGPSEGNVLAPIPDTPTTGILPDTDDKGGSDGTPRTSVETRPVNLALNYLIRWAP